MSYRVFARRLRPTRFDELVGQDHVVRALVHGLESDRVHHAYLFTGTRGVGKTTIARILAKCLNCEAGVSANPCGECTSCVEIAEGRHVDLLEVDAASRTKVEDTRDLLDNVQYLPTRGRYKIYLIDEVHMLSGSSFNALLKTLEEPPDHVKFLLATTDPKKVPLTVLSRCLQLQLKNLLPERIGEYLAEVLGREDIQFDDDALAQIARAGRGSMRDALSITDQAVAHGGGEVRGADVAAMLGSIEQGELEALMNALSAGDAQALLTVCADLAERAADFSEVLGALAALLHDVAVTQAVAGRGMEESGLAQRMAEELGPETVQLFYQIALLGQRDLHLAPDPRCGFEMTVLRMLAFEPVPPDRSSRQSDAKSAATSAEGVRPVDAGVEPAAKSMPGNVPEARNVPEAGNVPEGRGPAPATQRKSASPNSDEEVEAWCALVDQLALSGVARMIAEHAIGVPRGAPDAASWSLRLDPNHDTLLSDAPVANLGRVLSEHFGYPVDVRVEVADPGAETPAQRRERIAREQKAQAVAILEADENVRSLVEAFDAELKVDSVKPL